MTQNRGRGISLLGKLIICLMIAIFLATVPKAADGDEADAWLFDPPDYTDDTEYRNFIGRLYIQDVGIDVALYHSNAQYVVDRQDSAAYFHVTHSPRCWLIADHNTQAFKPLTKVELGMKAQIVFADGTFTEYECVRVLNGHNVGWTITDEHWVSVVPSSEMLMYTCLDCSENVRVVIWESVERGSEDADKTPDEDSAEIPQEDMVNSTEADPTP